MQTHTSWYEFSTGLPSSAEYYGVYFADINNDTYLDIAGGVAGNGICVWKYTSTTWQSASTNLPTTGIFYDVGMIDINTDGFTDIAAGSDNGIHVWCGDGTGRWTSASTGLPTSGVYYGIALADIDNDGDIDICTTSNSGVHSFRQDENMVWSDASNGLPSGNFEGGTVIADMNGDANFDIVAVGFPGVKVYLGDGKYNWTDASTGLPQNWFTGVAVADVDCDADLDIIVSSYECPVSGGGYGVRVYKNDGTANPSWTQNSTGLPTAGSYIDVCTADVNADGNPDIISTSYESSGTSNGIEIYIGDGGTSWQKDLPTGLPSTGRYIGICVADINDDGYPDICASYSSGISVWLNSTSTAISELSKIPFLIFYMILAAAFIRLEKIRIDGSKCISRAGRVRA